jgi:hypothetical protein
MRISDQFPSKYLRASDVETETTVVMKGVEIEEVGMDRNRLPVLYLEGYDKGLVLNRTNSGTIATLYGDDTEEWKGESIALFSAMVSFQGETKPAIRVKAPSRKKVAAAQASDSQKKISTPLPRLDTANDEIPF